MNQTKPWASHHLTWLLSSPALKLPRHRQFGGWMLAPDIGYRHTWPGNLGQPREHDAKHTTTCPPAGPVTWAMLGGCSRLELARLWHGLSNMRGSCSQSHCQRGRGGVQRMPGIAVLQSSPLCSQQRIANPLQAQDPMEAVCKKTCSPQMQTCTPKPRDWGYKPTCVPACLCIMCMLMWVDIHLCRPQCDVCDCLWWCVHAYA